MPHPDRIYFDLHGARLGAELVGKSFDVTDDGFLKKIRAAQSGPDVTRVVLDVSDVSEYSAFLLPNPYRLIIDIHGGKPEGPRTPPATDLAEVPVAPAAARQASVAASQSGLPAMAPTSGGEPVRSTTTAKDTPARQGCFPRQTRLGVTSVPARANRRDRQANSGAGPCRTQLPSKPRPRQPM